MNYSFISWNLDNTILVCFMCVFDKKLDLIWCIRIFVLLLLLLSLNFLKILQTNPQNLYCDERKLAPVLTIITISSNLSKKCCHFDLVNIVVLFYLHNTILIWWMIWWVALLFHRICIVQFYFANSLCIWQKYFEKITNLSPKTLLWWKKTHSVLGLIKISSNLSELCGQCEYDEESGSSFDLVKLLDLPWLV